MAPRLHQVLALYKSVKSAAYAALTDLHKQAQVAGRYAGQEKTYRALAEEGESFPSESKHVELRADAVLARAQASRVEYLRLLDTIERTNQRATASVTVDGVVLIESAPATLLLALEKELTDLRTFLANLPTLDEGKLWTLDVNSGLYRSEKATTNRMKRVKRPLVLYPATPEHPAQTQMIEEDVLAGYWDTTHLSGALPGVTKAAMLARADRLLAAVKVARGQANEAETVPGADLASILYGFILRG